MFFAWELPDGYGILKIDGNRQFSKTRCLDVYGGANTTKVYNNRSFPKRYGTDAQLCIYNGGSNQKWVFEKVGMPSYQEIATSSRGQNCAGFALLINDYIESGDFGVSDGTSVETMANKTIEYFKKVQPNRTIRRIAGVNNSPTFSINPNEYRIALRVINTNTDSWDYHYMIQTSNGWAHKLGGNPSQLLGNINPSTSSWPGLYNSNIIYFAVSR